MKNTIFTKLTTEISATEENLNRANLNWQENYYYDEDIIKKLALEKKLTNHTISLEELFHYGYALIWRNINTKNLHKTIRFNSDGTVEFSIYFNKLRKNYFINYDLTSSSFKIQENKTHFIFQSNAKEFLFKNEELIYRENKTTNTKIISFLAINLTITLNENNEIEKIIFIIPTLKKCGKTNGTFQFTYNKGLSKLYYTTRKGLHQNLLSTYLSTNPEIFAILNEKTLNILDIRKILLTVYHTINEDEAFKNKDFNLLPVIEKCLSELTNQPDKLKKNGLITLKEVLSETPLPYLKEIIEETIQELTLKHHSRTLSK